VNSKKILGIYKRLHEHFGPRNWWPADTPFEVMIGAILTQNTSWKNVEKAISNLKKKKLMSPRRLHKINHKTLASVIKPAGFFNVKAKRVKNFVNFLFIRYNYSINDMRKTPLSALRKELLLVNGIGPETADSILLYATGKPVFVIDAYTKRIFQRHGFIKKDIDYHKLQRLFMDNLPLKTALFNEYHALLVELAKTFCRGKPLCGECPLEDLKR